MAFAGEISYLTPLDAPQMITRQEEPVSWSTSFWQTVNRHHGVVNKLRKVDRHLQHFEPEENFNGWRWLSDHQGDYEDVIPAFMEVIPQHVNEAVSEEHLLDTIRRVRYEQQTIREAAAGGFTAGLAGGFASVALDPLAWATIGLSHKLFLSHKAFAAVAGSRAGLAGLHASAGMFEAAVDEFFLHQAQYLRGMDESALNIALSGIFSAAIGSLFPHPVVRQKGQKSMQQLYNEGPELHHVVPDTIDGRASIGAAEVEKGSELIAGWRPGVFSRYVTNQMSPIGRAVNMITDWTEALRKGRAGTLHGDAANKAFRSHWALMENLVDTHLLTKENLKGMPTLSAEALKNNYRGFYTSFIASTNETFEKTMRNLGQSTSMLNPNSWRGLRQSMFFDDLGSYRLALEAGKDAAWTPSARTSRHLADPSQVQMYKQGIKEASDHVSKFYKNFADEMVKQGMLDPADIKDNYFAHMYNREAINDNPDAFRALLRERFLKEPDEAFVQNTYGKSWASMNVDEQAVVLADWEAVVRGRKEQYAQDLMDHAARILRDAPQDIKALKKLKTHAGQQKFLEEVRLARENATARRAELERIHHRAEQRAIRMQHMIQQRDRYLAQPVPTGKKAFAAHQAKIRRLDGVISEQKKWLTAKTNALQKGARELNMLDARISRAEARLASRKTMQAIAARALTKRQKEIKAALAEQKKAAKILKEVDYKKALDDQVEAVIEALRDRHRTPWGFLPDDVVEASGRAKQRQIHWGDMLADPRLQGFMHHNPMKSLLGYTEDVGSRLAIRHRFGEESMATAIRSTRSAYDTAVAEARKAGDEKLLKALLDGEHKLTNDVHHLRDAMLGRLRVGDSPHTAAMWWARQFRQNNFLRSLGRSTIASVTDPVLVKSSNDASIKQLVRAMWHNFGNLKKVPDKELRRMIEGFELATAYNRQLVTYGLDDYIKAGQGYGHGWVRKLTGRIDDLGSTAVNVMNHANTQNLWNRYMRHVSAELFMGTAFDELPRYAAGNLPADKVGKWARLGIDQGTAGRIATLFKNHADNVDGVVYPKMTEWLRADPESARAFTTAWTTISTEGLVIPGLGDTPKFMSTMAGKLLLQFQAWNISVSRRFSQPMMQKAHAFGGEYATQALSNTVIAMGLGLFSYALRTHVGGAQPDRFYQQVEDFLNGKNTDLMWEAFLRSPLPGPISTPIEAVGKAMGPPVNNLMNQAGLPGLFPNASGKNIDRSAAALFFGPSYGTVETAFLAGQNFTSLMHEDVDAEQALRLGLKHSIRLAPFQNLWWSSKLVQLGQDTGIFPLLQED